jgi:Cys-tRNA(Pro)/Cys-tRNA(Cys) deacylase
MEKTNVMRLLDAAKIEYRGHEYDAQIVDGESVAKAVGKDSDCVFKTLVTVGVDRQNYVFVLPVNCTLSLKKAAKAVNVKSVEMIKLKELFPLTGYVHGGCSPIGQKKQLKTVIDETAQLFDTILFSGGKCGVQVELSPISLAEYIKAGFADITE